MALSEMSQAQNKESHIPSQMQGGGEGTERCEHEQLKLSACVKMSRIKPITLHKFSEEGLSLGARK